MSNIRIVLFYLKVEQVKIVQAIEKANRVVKGMALIVFSGLYISPLLDQLV